MRPLVLLAVLAVSVGDVHAQVLREPVPDRVVVLTFDDAVVSHATRVGPLLREYGFGGTFYVTEFREPPFSDKSLYMTWEQIRMLNQMGFEIGNHTARHTHVTRTTPQQLEEELRYIEARASRSGFRSRSPSPAGRRATGRSWCSPRTAFRTPRTRG